MEGSVSPSPMAAIPWSMSFSAASGRVHPRVSRFAGSPDPGRPHAFPHGVHRRAGRRAGWSGCSRWCWAKTKGKVERSFRYIREDFFLGRSFRNREISTASSASGSIRSPISVLTPPRTGSSASISPRNLQLAASHSWSMPGRASPGAPDHQGRHGVDGRHLYGIPDTTRLAGPPSAILGTCIRETGHPALRRTSCLEQLQRACIDIFVLRSGWRTQAELLIVQSERRRGLG